MAQPRPPAGDVPAPGGDPWRAFSYVTTGVVLYGLIGWGLDHWLGTTFLVAIGIVAGAAMGIFLTWKAFRPPDEAPPGPPSQNT